MFRRERARLTVPFTKVEIMIDHAAARASESH